MERLGLRSAFRIHDRLEWLVRDTDAFRRTARLLGMLGCDESYGLPEVAHTLEREHRLVLELEPVELLARHVLMREHGVHARHGHRLGDLDRDDARVRVRAPQRVAPQHAGRLQVARVRELPGDLRDSVLTRDNLADAAELELDAHVPAANRTASKIFA